MPKEEWGVKRVCPTTGKRFYDMNRSPVVSPYTGEAVNVDTGTKTRILAADKDDVDAKKKATEDDLLLDDDDVDLEAHETPEFCEFRWVPASTLPDLIVPFKKRVYRAIVTEFADLI